jgi:hypothetical protein
MSSRSIDPDPLAPFYHYARLLAPRESELTVTLARAGLHCGDMWPAYRRGECLPNALVGVLLDRLLGISLKEQQSALAADLRRRMTADGTDTRRREQARKPAGLKLATYGARLRQRRYGLTRAGQPVSLLQVRMGALAARTPGATSPEDMFASVAVSESTLSRTECGLALNNILMFFVIATLYRTPYTELAEWLLADFGWRP